MILIVMVALFVPLAAVAWFAWSAFAPARTTLVVEDNPALIGSLEQAAAESLAAGVGPLDESVITLPNDPKWASRLPDLAREVGGSALEMPSPDGGTRFLLTIPATAETTVRTELERPSNDAGTPAAPGEGTILLDIRIAE